jgi:transposase
MNMPNKFIQDLSDRDYQKLLENYQTATNFRIRNRSQAILLSFQKHPVDQIAQICRVHRTTVCLWIDKWNENQKLTDQERSGRPPILNEQEQAKALEIGLRNPKFPHRQLSEIERETGKEISQGTLKRMLKKRLSMETDQTRIMEADE